MKNLMASLASFKRQVEVGTVIECTENTLNPKAVGTREVIKVQTNGFWWVNEAIRQTKHGRAWTDYPKAADVVAVDDEQITWTLGRPEYFVTLHIPAGRV